MSPSTARASFRAVALSLAAALLFGCVSIDALSGRRRPLVESIVHGKQGPKLLLLEIDGTITDAEQLGTLGLIASESTTARVREQLDRARDEGDIEGLILRINSPGGSVTASDILYHEIERFKQDQEIPVVAQLMGTAASGGYYVAMSADEVIAHPTTVTGSIGVLFRGLNYSGLMEKLGVGDQSITSVPQKDIGSPLRPMTPEERALLEGIVDDFHARFKQVVAAGRPGLDEARVDELSDGRVYTARQALAHGLVDGIGYLDDAIAAAERRAGLTESRLVSYHRPREWRTNFYSRSPQGEPRASLLDPAGALGAPGFYYLWWPAD